MPRKMIYIGNHIKSSKTLKDEEFFQSLSGSPEHPLPNKDQFIINKINSTELGRENRKKIK